ncbi:HNH endonuclease [Streptomyces katsurahamanus]|uniref:HNH endonuclease n=1 Tax=Streptomyces katsurahamanus TaxID=2577098 RepID=A0ABW9P3K5_9ACTN|nr:HNH endonuclease [Streptomyces katsurahamanus]
MGTGRSAQHMSERVRSRLARDRARTAALSGWRARDRESPPGVRKAELFARWSGLCCYCDRPAEHIDHVTPISKGGGDVITNVVPSCAPCNLDKGAQSLTEWASTFQGENE